MKLPAKLSLIAATLAAIGTSVAFADDQQLRSRLDLQRAQAERSPKSTTVGVYAVKGLTLGRTESSKQRSEGRFEWRTPIKGQPYRVFVPAR
jgi:hypothetical protein